MGNNFIDTTLVPLTRHNKVSTKLLVNISICNHFNPKIKKKKKFLDNSRNCIETSLYLFFTTTKSHNGQSVQKNPNIFSESDLDLWLKASEVSLIQNCISEQDRWIAISFVSRENLMLKIGPSGIESEVEVARGLKGTVFHEKICWVNRTN